MITPGKKSHSTCGQEAGAGAGPETSAWRKREKILKFGGRDQELVATQGHGTRAGVQRGLRALSQREAAGLGGWGLPRG